MLQGDVLLRTVEPLREKQGRGHQVRNKQEKVVKEICYQCLVSIPLHQ